MSASLRPVRLLRILCGSVRMMALTMPVVKRMRRWMFLYIMQLPDYKLNKVFLSMSFVSEYVPPFDRLVLLLFCGFGRSMSLAQFVLILTVD
ncbi:uncharacterized protein EV420DRAFT_887063 [Desarmillaria tabescens]|uniref:Uncharacterized protein n=1 Tax=Armillaria tabescens TaxID=1929756 RepID=A0AA39JSB4_ARMTA|nr:uncharacterized protein EV420DRAFT_887063 [Desarmillaria tabescens]KAK0447030.1 hypothetical protein EV420DRAFT_887063 [Desarmillaria tabescens]